MVLQEACRKLRNPHRLAVKYPCSGVKRLDILFREGNNGDNTGTIPLPMSRKPAGVRLPVRKAGRFRSLRLRKGNNMSVDSQEKSFLNFPDNFVWGCATSPTQVEGETVNEWANRIASDGSTADDGSNHWRRYRYDFRCMAAMNMKAYRLGFDWARLQPGPRQPLVRDVKLRYMEMLAELRSHGIEPYLTLFHHACPKWFAEQGGWLNPESPELFADFARRLVILTDGEVRNWITINEPLCYAFLSYIAGVFPPNMKGRFGLYRKALANLSKAHALAYRAIHEHQPDANVGVTSLIKRVSPCRIWHPLDYFGAWAVSGYFALSAFDRFLHDGKEKTADYIGINYSGRLRTYGMGALSPLFVQRQTLSREKACCDNMWEQDPEWLGESLKTLHRRHNMPIYITGHGISTEDEGLRVRLLKQHLEICHNAIREGVDLKGYFYWSLLDNFDWSEGLSQKFGLVAVSFDDPERRRDIRRTGCIYGEIVRNNGFPA